MQRPALPREQVVGDRLALEGVPERVRVRRRILHQHVVDDRFAQRGDQRVRGQFEHAHEQPVTDARPGGRGHPQDGLRVRAQCLDAHHQRVAHVLGQMIAGRDQLLGVERVALGASEQIVDQPRLGPPAEDALELRPQLLAREARHRHAGHRGRALGLGQERAQRMAPVQLVGPVGGHERDPLAPRGADQEGEEVACRAVGPVQVLDHQQQRLAVARQAAQQGQQQLEQPALGQGAGGRRAVGLAELGQQRREPGRRRAGDRLDLVALEARAARRRSARTAARCHRARRSRRRGRACRSRGHARSAR